jgi:DNA helicase HerA-like ATPase
LHIKNLKGQTLENSNPDILNTYTVDSPIPYNINDLLMMLRDDDTRKGVGKTGPVKGDWEGKLTRFISRLEAKIDDKRYGFLFQPPDEVIQYDWLFSLVKNLLGFSKQSKGIKIIDFSEVPSDVVPVVAGTLARILYDIQFWMQPAKRTPFTLLCDEAHIYLPVKENANSTERQSLENFERIAKEGRKYGCSLLVVSQRPSDVSTTILSQCNNFIVLRLTNDRDQAVVKKLLPDSFKGITDCLPLLDTGEALILGDSILLPNRIKLDKPTIEPDSMTKNFWNEWAINQPDNDSLKEAIENLRSQSRNII